jgi:hypothetical protein
MTEEKLRLRYIEDTNTILQVWIIFPYIICLSLDCDGIMHELLIDQCDEYI